MKERDEVCVHPPDIPLGLPATVTLKMLSLSWHWPQTNTRLDTLSCSVSVVTQGPHPCTNVEYFPLSSCCFVPVFRQSAASGGGLLSQSLSHNQSVWNSGMHSKCLSNFPEDGAVTEIRMQNFYKGQYVLSKETNVIVHECFYLGHWEKIWDFRKRIS